LGTYLYGGLPTVVGNAVAYTSKGYTEGTDFTQAGGLSDTLNLFAGQMPLSGDHALRLNGSVSCNQSAVLSCNAPLSYSLTFQVATVPIPAAVWLFGGALAGLGLLRRRQNSIPRV
jgi:hypothetical protein